MFIHNKMKSKPKLSDMFDEAFKKVAQGRKPSEIIRLTGMPSATVYQKLKKFGLWHKGVQNQTHKNSIRKMRSQDPRISVARMANILGLPYSTTHTYTVELEQEEIARRTKLAEERTKRGIKRKVQRPVAEQHMEESVEFVIEEVVGDETVVQETFEEETIAVQTFGEETVGEEVAIEAVVHMEGSETDVHLEGSETDALETVPVEAVALETVGVEAVAQETLVELAVVDDLIAKEVVVEQSPERLKGSEETAAIEELEAVGEMLWTTDIDWAAAAEAEGEHP